VITELNVEVVERPFEVVLELAANGAQLQTAQAQFIGSQPPPSEDGQALYPVGHVAVLEVGVRQLTEEQIR
jgi:hypothetical protein